jgi:hypothetical protein
MSSKERRTQTARIVPLERKRRPASEGGPYKDNEKPWRVLQKTADPPAADESPLVLGALRRG